jgi:hypothetical protein
MATRFDPDSIDIEEQFARIRKMIAESDKIQDERRKLAVETKFAPWQFALGGVTAGAALFAAAAAFTKLLL